MTRRAPTHRHRLWPTTARGPVRVPAALWASVAARTPAGKAAFVALGVLGGCCSAQNSELGPVRTAPRAVRASAAAVAQASKRASREELDLDRFTPLLALPKLAQAAQALQDGRFAAAVHEVEQAMTAEPPTSRDVPRWQYLLGRLREKSGDIPGALASYQLASARSWPLRGYAVLGAGRALVRLGRTDEATAMLERVPGEGPPAADAGLLLAEAAELCRDFPRAVGLYRSHLAIQPLPDDWADASLHLASALLEGQASPAAQTSTATELSPVREALQLARRVRLKNAGSAGLAERAKEIEERALLAFPPDERQAIAPPSPDERLLEVQALVDRRHWEDALVSAAAVVDALPQTERFGTMGCAVEILRAKALAGTRQWGPASSGLGQAAAHCRSDGDQRARILYLAGKYSASDGRDAEAIRYYTQLEREAREHSLADDARLNAANAYLELGVEARFTELLSTMLDDYPVGDRTLEGVFRLAIRRIEKGDWPGAASVLGRAAVMAREHETGRGAEFSGRERYFHARALMQTGELDRGRAELEQLIVEVPLSYYMLQAFTRLSSLDSERARRLLDDALARSAGQKGLLVARPEFSTPGFIRAMELLRLGEIDFAQREIAALGFATRNAQPAILWGVAVLYDRAGATRLSHAIARGLLTDWLGRYPAGEWTRAWQIAFPRPYEALVKREAQRSGIAEELVYAIMREESAFDPAAESPARAYGLMQMIVPTARQYAKEAGLPWDPESLKEPAISIALGCRMLGDLTRKFDTNPLLAIPGYNAGPGRPRRWLREHPGLDFDVWVELIPFEETRRYTKRVLSSRAVYALLSHPERASEVLRLPLGSQG
ncbi:MAG: transglycosylase SLT domain-containing protein [Polyangiaceae bacterium]|nr:transglycosylase SLT domain-containing protein [Polyangiaceae bacterium]